MKKVSLLVLAIFIASFIHPARSQVRDTLSKKLDSLDKKAENEGRPKNDIREEAYNYNTRISGRIYFKLLASDFKQQITKPFHMKARSWLKLGIFSASVAALTATDEPIQRFALKLNQRNEWVSDISRTITRFGGVSESFVLIGLGGYGFIDKNIKMQTTSLLASQAYLNSAVISAVLKRVFGRQRPDRYDINVDEAEPTFHGPFFGGGKDINGKRLNTSFPSGHATAAFSAATVFAQEYKDRRLVPVISYTLASLISFSRITENKHWFTDILAGAVLGYLNGRQVVDNYHRYSKIKAAEEHKSQTSINFIIDHGVVEPGIVYRFR